jgi:hypothetical protein
MIEQYGICRNKEVFDICLKICNTCNFYERVTKEEYDNFNEYKTVEKIHYD